DYRFCVVICVVRHVATVHLGRTAYHMHGVPHLLRPLVEFRWRMAKLSKKVKTHAARRMIHAGIPLTRLPWMPDIPEQVRIKPIGSTHASSESKPQWNALKRRSSLVTGAPMSPGRWQFIRN